VGVRLAYAAQHLSLAMIEYFVHIDPVDPPKDLVVVTADIPAALPGRQFLKAITGELASDSSAAGLGRYR